MSSRPLVIITTRLPPQVCGIGTYSWLLHQHWNPKRPVEFCVIEGAAESRDVLNFPDISQFDSRPNALAAALREAGAADVLLHYAGRAYHRYGFPRWLPPVIQRWKRDFPGGRLLIFFHEMPGHFPWISRYFWMDRLNRNVIADLGRLADGIATNTQEHATQLTQLSGRGDILVVPVPSNIEPPPGSVRKAKRGEFVLLGLPFGRGQTLRCFARELREWQESGRLTRLHIIGPNDDKFAPRSRELLRALPNPGAVVEHGMLPSEEVSALLLQAEYGLSNATGLTWSKSSIFMTYAAHGCNVVVADKANTEPLSLAIASGEVGHLSDVDLARRAADLQRWYQSHATWPAIAEKISSLLPVENTTHPSSSEDLLIITPEAAGDGGVGDYARRVVEAFPHSASITTEVWPVNRERLTRAGKLLVQYSAYGFDRHGYPRRLIRDLLSWKRSTGGKLVIMFHEIWTFWPRANKNAAVQFFHRRGIGRLVQAADAIFTTTARQAEYLREFAPHKNIGVVPVGSNIPVRSDIGPARHHDWSVLFGLVGSRVRALREMHGALCDLARAGRIKRIVTVGGGETSQVDVERQLLASIPLEEGFQQLGRRSEAEVSEQLLSAGFGISERDELSLSKSGTLMAYAAHNLNVLSPVANPTRPLPVSLFVSPDELLRGLTDGELVKRADQLREWQNRVSSWTSIASVFADALK